MIALVVVERGQLRASGVLLTMKRTTIVAMLKTTSPHSRRFYTQLTKSDNL